MSPILGIWASSRQPALNANSYESISTVTVGAGGSSTIDFTSIPSTYTHLQIRGIVRNTGSTADIDMYMQFNGDTASNYNWHFLYGINTTVGTGATANDVYINSFRSTGASSTASIFGAGVVDILDYANTNKFKTTRLLTGNEQNASGSSLVLFESGAWRSTSAITSIKFYFPTGSFAQYSQLALYGIKGS